MQLTLAASALVVNVQCHLVAESSLDTPACPHDEEDSDPGSQNMLCIQKISTEKHDQICKLFFFISSYR